MQCNPKKQKTSLLSEEVLQRKLHAAMKYAHDVCIIGATNRMHDIKRTGGWSFAQQFRYDHTGKYVRAADEADKITHMFLCNIFYDENENDCDIKQSNWFYRVDNVLEARFCNTPMVIYKLNEQDPLADRVFRMPGEKLSIFYSSLRAESTRSGNCGTQSRLVTKYLWEHPEGIHRIEGVSMDSFDHLFIIVNRSGDMQSPDTWGDAWIVDPWALGGVIYSAKNFIEKLKEIKTAAKSEVNELFNIGLYTSSASYPEDDHWHRVFEVCPQTETYPRYDERLRIDDYYAYNDNRFISNPDIVKLTSDVIQGRHALKFDDCLNEIGSIKSNPKWFRLFHHDNQKKPEHDVNQEEAGNAARYRIRE